MKIKIGQKVYLQKYDIAFIMHELSIVPASFMDELFKDKQPFIMSCSEDGYIFDCIFEDPGNVAWIMDQDWIIDYNQYKDTRPTELRNVCEETAEEVSISIRDFNSRDATYRSKYYNEFNEKISKTIHKLDSIEAMIEYLDGKLEFVFPEQTTNLSPISKPAKKPGFFARLFGRGTQ